VQHFLSRPVTWSRHDGITAPGHWTQGQPNTVINGDLNVAGNLMVGTGKHDGGFLIVFGDVKCQNFCSAPGFTFACTGSLSASQAVIATAGNSATYVAGRTVTTFLDSGAGAWLTLFDSKSLAVGHLSRYVMINGRPVRQGKPDLLSLLVPKALETEEWDSLSAGEQKNESPKDYVRVDTQAVRSLMAQGESILKAS
jgi:hypothetical protein